MSDLRFLFLADTQLGCYATFSGMDAEQVAGFAAREMRVEPVPRVEGFEWDASRFERAIAIANESLPDFVLIGGDMIDDLSDSAQTDEFFRITALLRPEIPIRWVPGNHDAAFDYTVPSVESLARYRALFGDDYYSFEHGSTVIVVLNTVVASHPTAVPGEWEAQLGFLARTLEHATSHGDHSVIVAGHHPLFIERADEDDSYWNVPRAQRAPMLELLHRYDVQTVFAGHWHRNAVAWDGDLQMVTSGPVGYPLGDDPSGYRVVDVDAGVVTHRYVPLDA